MPISKARAEAKAYLVKLLEDKLVEGRWKIIRNKQEIKRLANEQAILKRSRAELWEKITQVRKEMSL